MAQDLRSRAAYQFWYAAFFAFLDKAKVPGVKDREKEEQHPPKKEKSRRKKKHHGNSGAN
jgi:hypothetical protein